MDIQHFYIEKGQGAPLLLLHGNGEDSSYFRGQIDFFAQRYHVHAIDTRGHGKTPRGDQPFTFSQFADDLRGFMDAHQMEKAHILGFSDGGNIAIAFALRYPERVDRLILNSANLSPAGAKRTIQIPIEIGYRFASLFAGRFAFARQKAEMLGLMENQPNVTPEELADIHAKTLVIAGTHDMIRPKHTKLIADSIPGAALVFLKGTHFVASKHPEEFNQAILEFLQS